ncbi:Uma2 family endonuclease [Paractinoplanes hotanensis]|uniref:Uma2 family endonuclease n=1 Tax=Paractinoplanes hotanensis TaxID=2906497 RepID=A0ABT0Y7B9_9ACTN|nr:Uma2 family endonuclease [Actinoplanes hotanensis]MCM4081931.1 Uma2 family endonuclease [Actinoplanes hotanensis]
MSAVRNDWTADELDAFPEDHVRREVLDGVFRTSRSLPSSHQALTALLAVELTRSCPEHLLVTHANELVLSPRRRITSDVLAVNFSAAQPDTNKFHPADTALVVEVVSDGSEHIDSVIKPAYCAEAGIPFYWLVETKDGITVSVYELNRDEKIYEPLETFSGDDTIVLDRPWRIEIPLSSVRPRNL